MLNFITAKWQQCSDAIHRLILRYGTRQFLIFVLAGLALADAFVPVSANLFVIILAILQPSRTRLTVLVFAISAGISAFMLATLLGEFKDASQWFGLNTFGAQWDQAKMVIGQYGPSALIFLAIFPDIPRISIAVISLSDVAPVWIGLMVFAGKIMLYSGLVAIMDYLPKRWGSGQPAQRAWQRWLQRRSRRFQAYRRRLGYLVLTHQSSL